MEATRRTWPERFWAKVEKTETCWIWLGRKTHDGYGTVWFDGRQHVVHRIAYEMHAGPIPDGLQIDHVCRNRSCVNPAHMEPVTQRENIRRGVSPAGLNARKTHCKRGHEFTPDNTGIVKRGRYCRTCYRASNARWLARRRGAVLDSIDQGPSQSTQGSSPGCTHRSLR